MAENGWISTTALADGGTGPGQLSIVNDQIADGTLTAAKFAPGAGAAGYYGLTPYGGCAYG